MSQQIDRDKVEHSSPGLEVQDPTLTSKNPSKETESKPVLETEFINKKSFSERWKTNRFWLVRGSYHVLRSVWMAVMMIGGFIAWLISLLFI